VCAETIGRRRSRKEGGYIVGIECGMEWVLLRGTDGMEKQKGVPCEITTCRLKPKKGKGNKKKVSSPPPTPLVTLTWARVGCKCWMNMQVGESVLPRIRFEFLSRAAEEAAGGVEMRVRWDVEGDVDIEIYSRFL